MHLQLVLSTVVEMSMSTFQPSGDRSCKAAVQAQIQTLAGLGASHQLVKVDNNFVLLLES